MLVVATNRERVAHVVLQLGNKARRAPRGREHVRRAHPSVANTWNRRLNKEAFSLGQHRARAALGSRTTASLNASRIYFIRISSECASHDSSEMDRTRAALMRPSTSSRPSSSAGLVSTPTLLQPLRLASAVLRPLNLPADFEGGDPASSRVVISDAATDDSLNKPASLAPHQVADEPKASGASSLALQAHATHAAQLSELLASTNVSDKPAAASDPSDALDGVLANLQKQRQRIAAQQQAAEQPRPEAPSINPAPAAAAAPSASADAEQGEAEEEADEEVEEVEEVLFRCFPSHVASLFSAGSAELREMAIDRLSTHLRETAAADDEDEDEEGGGMTSLHAFAAEAELAAANVQAAVQRQEAAADSPEAPPRFCARAAPLDPSDTLLFGSHEDEEEEDDGAGGSGAAPTASVEDRLHGCCLILREALHDPNLQVMLSALTLLDPEGPLSQTSFRR